MSRGYDGAYRVLLMLVERDGEEVYGFTDVAAYEDCERACLWFGMGMPYERRRVIRSLIVPVSGEHPPIAGTDFGIESM